MLTYEEQIQNILKKRGFATASPAPFETIAAELGKCIKNSIRENVIYPKVAEVIERAMEVKVVEDVKMTIYFDKNEATRYSVYNDIDNDKFEPYGINHDDTAFLPLVYNYSNDWKNPTAKYYNKAKKIGKYVLKDKAGMAHEKGAEFIEKGLADFRAKYPNENVKLVKK
jgi:hypothetical protein